MRGCFRLLVACLVHIWLHCGGLNISFADCRIEPELATAWFIGGVTFALIVLQAWIAWTGPVEEINELSATLIVCVYTTQISGWVLLGLVVLIYGAKFPRLAPVLDCRWVAAVLSALASPMDLDKQREPQQPRLEARRDGGA